MKKEKIYIFGIAYYTNGTNKTSRTFANPDAFSRWANREYKRDESVTIYEYHFSYTDDMPILACTWHA